MRPRFLNYRFFLDILGQALSALRDNRLRTTLSVLGISIGVAAVMIVATVSKGGRHVVFSELQTFGLKTIWVYRDYAEKDPRKVMRSGTGIENRDVSAAIMGAGSTIHCLTPIVLTKEKLQVRKGNRYCNGKVEGAGPAYLDINRDSLVRGRFLKDEDISHKRYVAVIGPDVRNDLFHNELNPVGREFRISGKRFTVVGLFARKSRDFLSSIGSAGGQNVNDRVLIPYTVLQELLGTKDIDVLEAETAGLKYTDIAVSRIKSILNRNHGGRYSYRAETMAKYIETTENILRGVTLIGVIAASVSLFVGGMGIMNIMSTSVLERTREIGIRKALGARRQAILMQFLLEAMLISSIGGVFGLIIGLLAGSGLALATGFPLNPSWPMVFAALAVSTGVGLASGYYPAYRAATLKPVEALRFE